MIKFPGSNPSLLILLNLEKQDIAWASGYECRVVDQVHLAEIHFGHPVEGVVGHIFGVYDEGLALSVEAVDFISLFVVETLVREVLFGAGQNEAYNLALNLLGFKVVQEMVVGESGVVEKLHVNDIIGDEATVDERVREGLDAHGVVV